MSGLSVATTLAENDECTVIQLGGVLRNRSFSGAGAFAGPAATNPHENGGNEIKVKRNLRIPIVFSSLCRVKVSATGVFSCRN